MSCVHQTHGEQESLQGFHGLLDITIRGSDGKEAHYDYEKDGYGSVNLLVAYPLTAITDVRSIHHSRAKDNKVKAET